MKRRRKGKGFDYLNLPLLLKAGGQTYEVGRINIDLGGNWTFTGHISPEIAAHFELLTNLGSLALNPVANYIPLAPPEDDGETDDIIAEVREALVGVVGTEFGEDPTGDIVKALLKAGIGFHKR